MIMDKTWIGIMRKVENWMMKFVLQKRGQVIFQIVMPSAIIISVVIYQLEIFLRYGRGSRKLGTGNFYFGVTKIFSPRSVKLKL